MYLINGWDIFSCQFFIRQQFLILPFLWIPHHFIFFLIFRRPMFILLKFTLQFWDLLELDLVQAWLDLVQHWHLTSLKSWWKIHWNWPLLYTLQWPWLRPFLVWCYLLRLVVMRCQIIEIELQVPNDIFSLIAPAFLLYIYILTTYILGCEEILLKIFRSHFWCHVLTVI